MGKYFGKQHLRLIYSRMNLFMIMCLQIFPTDLTLLTLWIFSSRIQMDGRPLPPDCQMTSWREEEMRWLSKAKLNKPILCREGMCKPLETITKQAIQQLHLQAYLIYREKISWHFLQQEPDGSNAETGKTLQFLWPSDQQVTFFFTNLR